MQAYMKFYNKGTERNPLVDYSAFVNGLRIPLEGKRLGVVRQAFDKMSNGASQITVGQARVCFSYDDFEKWCDAMECSAADGTVVSWQKFSDFYADISMVMIDDKKLIALVSDTWGLQELGTYMVDTKDVETLLAAIRHNLLKYGSSRHSEEFVLREVFRDFDRDNSGSLTINELRGMLFKINLTTDECYLKALIKRLDTNGNGVIEFEELQRFIVSDPYHRV